MISNVQTSQQAKYVAAFGFGVILFMMMLSYHSNNNKYDDIETAVNNQYHDAKAEFNNYLALHNQKLSFPDARILPIINVREELGNILEDEGKTTGVEVGVQKGIFAKDILTRWKSCKSYALVDPWKHQENYNDHANINQRSQDQNFEITKKNLASFEDRTKLHYMRMFSSEAAKQIPDKSMDFVFLDARHDYQAVWQDLELFWPKLKDNGIFAGHDFLNANEVRNGQDWCLFDNGQRCENHKAVKAAVQEFARKVNRQVVTTKQDAWASWYMRK